MPEYPLSLDKGYRHSVDKKIRAAGRLLQAALVDLGDVTVPDVASEVDRRELELLCRAVASLTSDLTARLSALAADELISAYACPHCGWSRPCLQDGTCPRCSGLREAYRDPGRIVRLAESRARRNR